MKLFLRHGEDTKRVKVAGDTIEKEALLTLFREKFGLPADAQPFGNAVYLADEDFRDVTFELEDPDDVYNGAVIHWRLKQRRSVGAKMNQNTQRRATASGKAAFATPGVMAAIAAKKAADAVAAEASLEKEQKEADEATANAEKEKAEAEAA